MSVTGTPVSVRHNHVRTCVRCDVRYFQWCVKPYSKESLYGFKCEATPADVQPCWCCGLSDKVK